MTPEEKLQIEERIVTMLKTVYDPEIPVDIYNLGLIYSIDLDDDGNLKIDMTLTAPNCPAADFLVEDARIKLESIEGVKSVDIRIVFEPEWTKDMMSEDARIKLESISELKSVNINIVFEPEWTRDMMSEEAKLDLGFL